MFSIGTPIGLVGSNGIELRVGNEVCYHIDGNSNKETTVGVVTYSKRRAAFMFKHAGFNIPIFNNIPSSMCLVDPEPNFYVIKESINEPN